MRWLLNSERPTGGSAAYQTPLFTWSRAYPETTGYLIPTLLRAAKVTTDARLEGFARRCGEWLVRIQNEDGSWNGGLHPPRRPSPSVFNTGQILLGMMALWRETVDERWLQRASSGASWMISTMSPDGLWPGGDYRAQRTPTYYSHALWPLLDVVLAVGDRQAVERIQHAYTLLLDRIQSDGWISEAGFAEGEPAFTHTIAYTIRGIQEGGRLLNDDSMLAAVEPTIERIVRIAELRGGRLPGGFFPGWIPSGRFICLTGNVQMAESILLLEARVPDLRLVSAAARLVDIVCSSQRSVLPSRRPQGRVGGSKPLHGPYMRLRFPNWAAKYLVDALIVLMTRIEAEL